MQIDKLMAKLMALDDDRRMEIVHYLRMAAEHLRSAIGPYRESAGVSALHRASVEIEDSKTSEDIRNREKEILTEAWEAGQEAEREAVVVWLQQQGGRPAWVLYGDVARGVHRWGKK